MSPEQAKGRAADRRSDVWSFGCLLFEMLAGSRAFQGDDVTDTIAAIVRGEPDWKALPATTPPALRQLIERCLTKDRVHRLPDMSVVRYILSEPGILATSPATGIAPATGPSDAATMDSRDRAALRCGHCARGPQLHAQRVFGCASYSFYCRLPVELAAAVERG